MNSKKIAFIIGSNAEMMYQQCTAFINRLEIPEGYEIDLVCIRGAVSMASAYNEAIGRTDAKYKVYLHQDVYLIYPRFLWDMLKIFESDEDIGLIGVLGGIGLPESGEMLNAWKCGRTMAWNGNRVLSLCMKEPDENSGFLAVEAVDGMLMITDTDILWREDLFDGWHFYDVSQSYEFRRRGFKVVVPYQRSAWCLHDCGPSSMENYEKYRKVLKREYKDFLGDDPDEYVTPYQPDFYKYAKELLNKLDFLADNTEPDILYDLVDEIYNSTEFFKGLEKFRLLEEIYRLEKRAGIRPCFCESEQNYQNLYISYRKIKNLLCRLEYGIPEAEEELRSMVSCKRYSAYVFYSVIRHNCWDYSKMKHLLKEAFRSTGQEEAAEILSELSFDMKPLLSQ